MSKLSMEEKIKKEIRLEIAYQKFKNFSTEADLNEFYFTKPLPFELLVDYIYQKISEEVAQARKEERIRTIGEIQAKVVNMPRNDYWDWFREFLTSLTVQEDHSEQVLAKSDSIKSGEENSSEYDCPNCDSPGLMHVCPNKPMVCCSDCQQEESKK